MPILDQALPANAEVAVEAEPSNIEGSIHDIEDLDWDSLSIDLGGEGFVRTIVLCNVAT